MREFGISEELPEYPEWLDRTNVRNSLDLYSDGYWTKIGNYVCNAAHSVI